MTVDVVCQMEVDETVTEHWIVLAGKTYYFCSEGCRAELSRHQEDYLIGNQSDISLEAGLESKQDANV